MAFKAKDDVDTTIARTKDQQNPPTQPASMQRHTSDATSPLGEQSSRGDIEGSEPTVNVNTTISQLPKLDGVLYHYYSKTLAAIVQSRLTHYEPSSKSQSSRGSENPSSASTPATAPSSTRIRAKWFDLDLTDYDIFREEIRLWRNISALIPAEILEGSSSSAPSSDLKYVPTMIVDVILDPSLLDSQDVLTMDQSDAEGSKAKRRVRVRHSDTSDLQARRGSRGSEKKDVDDFRPIILETWRLELNVGSTPDAPELPLLYRQATANLKELLSVAKQLPVQGLYHRLQKDRDRKATDKENEKLNIGVRLRIGEVAAETTTDGVIGLHEPLIDPSADLGDKETPTKVTESFHFEPLYTAVGTLSGSVEYRRDGDFFVERRSEAQEDAKAADLDEDFFKPSITQPTRINTKVKSGTQSSPTSPPSGARRSLLSTTSKQSVVTSAQSIPTASTATPPSEGFKGPSLPSTSSTSVFSTSASSGKPVAGLANLRRSPSITAHGSSPGTTMTAISGAANTSSSSPIPPSAMTNEAAFLSTSRRTSTGERRLRSFNTLSGSAERDSPSAASNSGNSGSPSQQQGQGSPLNRPALARASISANTSLRTGSYSPSSPSPLALQMFTNAQQQQRVNSIQSRASSSPSNRIPGLPLSTSPSLRSIFQTPNTPSQSQLSVSSLSRTPPRSLIDADGSSISMQAPVPSTNEQGASSQQSSTLAEGRQIPSVKPQMIKRYSSTFNYRQGRQYSGTASGAQAESSLESEMSTSAPYSKSWQARIEQRQLFAARSLGRGEASASGSGAAFISSYSPPIPLRRRRSMGVSTSQEEDLDDFVRMIDLNQPTKSGEAAVVSSSQSGRRDVNVQPSSSSSVSAIRNAPPSRSAFGGNMSYSTAPSGVGFNRQYGWNRNQVDEMLNKMQASVRDFGTSSSTGKGSGTSGTSSSLGGGASGAGGIGSDSPSPGSQGGGASSGGGIVGAAGFSPSFVRSPLSKVGFSAATTSTYASGGRSSRSPSTATTLSSPQTQPLSSAGVALPDDQQRSSTLYQYDLHNSRSQSSRGRLSSHIQSAGMNIINATVAREGGVAECDENLDSQEMIHHVYDRSRRSTSGGSIESLSHPPHSYDPMEDEAVGRLELVHDDIDVSGDPINSGGDYNDGNNRNQQQQHHRHIHHTDHFSEAARRRADLELARNFGQTVSSGSSRGGNTRASLSPWRNRLHVRSGGNGQPTSPSLTSSPMGAGNNAEGSGSGNSETER